MKTHKLNKLHFITQDHHIKTIKKPNIIPHKNETITINKITRRIIDINYNYDEKYIVVTLE